MLLEHINAGQVIIKHLAGGRLRVGLPLFGHVSLFLSPSLATTATLGHRTLDILLVGHWWGIARIYRVDD